MLVDIEQVDEQIVQFQCNQLDSIQWCNLQYVVGKWYYVVYCNGVGQCDEFCVSCIQVVDCVVDIGNLVVQCFMK